MLVILATSTDGTALSLLHNSLVVRTVQRGTERLLVSALHVAVRTPAEVTPPWTPLLAVGQHWSQVVQGSAGLCNTGVSEGEGGVREILLRQVGQQRPGRGGSG